MTSALDEALRDAVAATDSVAALRADPVVAGLLRAYKAAPWARINVESISDELSQISANVAFSAKVFELDGLGPIKRARDSRFHIDAALDRVLTIARDLRVGATKTNKVMRVGLVYIRQHKDMTEKTVKHMDAVAEVVLREIVEMQDDIKLLLGLVKETVDSINGKVEVLDAWFNLHKQYVFLNSANRGPRGEQETHTSAQDTRRKLGRRSAEPEDEDED